MSVERSRKHGPFDARYPLLRHKPPAVSLWRSGEERCGWQGFLARFYPGLRRHDFDALAAYESYSKDHRGRPVDDSTPRRGGDEIERWEGEGGIGTAATTTKA